MPLLLYFCYYPDSCPEHCRFSLLSLPSTVPGQTLLSVLVTGEVGREHVDHGSGIRPGVLLCHGDGLGGTDLDADVAGNATVADHPLCPGLLICGDSVGRASLLAPTAIDALVHVIKGPSSILRGKFRASLRIADGVGSSEDVPEGRGQHGQGHHRSVQHMQGSTDTTMVGTSASWHPGNMAVRAGTFIKAGVRSLIRSKASAPLART